MAVGLSHDDERSFLAASIADSTTFRVPTSVDASGVAFKVLVRESMVISQ